MRLSFVVVFVWYSQAKLFQPYKVACALLLFDESLDNYAQVKHILVEMGVYFQSQVRSSWCFVLFSTWMLLFLVFLFSFISVSLVRFSFQDDYLDCFGEPEIIGKVSTLLQYYHKFHSTLSNVLWTWSPSNLTTDRKWHWRFQVFLAICSSTWARWWETKRSLVCKAPAQY